MTAPSGGPAPIPTLGRLRIAVGLVALLLLLAVSVGLYYLWHPFGRRNPWPRVFLGGVAWIAGVEVTVTGQRNRRGAFLLANHVSWLDIPAVAGATGTAFVAHDGLAAQPLLRWLCRMNGTVFIARHDRASVAKQVAQVREAIHDAGALTVFPEGTTSDGPEPLAFKSSLLSALDPTPAGIIVQPVWLDYGKDTAEIAWAGDEPGLDNFLRILARARPIFVTVHFLPPLVGDALSNRKAIAAAARGAIIAAMEKRAQRVAL